jgi:hypothetical protein|tara:strand:+ start:997 stop:1209 length:213 start_codon:yes stop_codon:yes gene_type:complete
METKLQLSNQALGAIMLALQESLMGQTDIVPILRGFELQEGKDGLVVMNPPTVRLDETTATDDDLEQMVK